MLKFFLLTALTGLATSQVAELNRTQYLGRWYQVYADLAVDVTFENSSYCDTADYGIYPNDTISVWNRERQYGVDGPEREIFGWAAPASNTTQGELTVHLQTTDFPAPYWVYELGPATYNGSQYQYSVVSDPLKFTLFVLARNVSLFMATWAEGVLERLKANGFTGVLNTPIPTVQENCTYW
jgi:apolipoprotein D and lipocalin family protein